MNTTNTATTVHNVSVAQETRPTARLSYALNCATQFAACAVAAAVFRCFLPNGLAFLLVAFLVRQWFATPNKEKTISSSRSSDCGSSALNAPCNSCDGLADLFADMYPSMNRVKRGAHTEVNRAARSAVRNTSVCRL